MGAGLEGGSWLPISSVALERFICAELASPSKCPGNTCAHASTATPHSSDSAHPSAVVGEVDEDKDASLDYSEIKAEPLGEVHF